MPKQTIRWFFCFVQDLLSRTPHQEDASNVSLTTPAGLIFSSIDLFA